MVRCHVAIRGSICFCNLAANAQGYLRQSLQLLRTRLVNALISLAPYLDLRLIPEYKIPKSAIASGKLEPLCDVNQVAVDLTA